MKTCENCNKEHNGNYGSGRFCSNKCAKGFSTKNKRKEINEFVSNKLKGNIVWNSGGEKVKNKCEYCNKDFVVRFSKRNQRFCSRSCRAKCLALDQTIKDKISEACKKANCGGHTSKKAMHYTTKSGKIIYLQSNYEIQVAEDLDKNNIEWIRPKPLIWLDEKGKSHRYYPDFYLMEYDVYLDPKNDYLIIKDKIKIKSVVLQNNVKVFVLDKNSLSWESIKLLIT